MNTLQIEGGFDRAERDPKLGIWNVYLCCPDPFHYRVKTRSQAVAMLLKQNPGSTVISR